MEKAVKERTRMRTTVSSPNSRKKGSAKSESDANHLVLFYWAGHGLSQRVSRENFLLTMATEETAANPANWKRSSVSLNYIGGKLSEFAASVLIFDVAKREVLVHSIK